MIKAYNFEEYLLNEKKNSILDILVAKSIASGVISSYLNKINSELYM